MPKEKKKHLYIYQYFKPIEINCMSFSKKKTTFYNSNNVSLNDKLHANKLKYVSCD